MSKIADKIKEYMSSKSMKPQDFYNAVSWDRSKYYRVVSGDSDLGINEILEIFEKLKFSDNEKINFLTGIIIEKKPEEIILECVELFKPIGLNVNIAKCKSTYDGGEITFMGQKFKGDSAISRSERLLATAKKCIEVIDHAPIEA